MRLQRFIGRVWGYLGLAMAGLLSLLILGYVTPAPALPELTGVCQVQVCVVSLGVHSNILVPQITPTFDWNNWLPVQQWQPAQTQSESTYRYLSFGWGERVFYRQSPTQLDQILALGWRALLLPNPAILRVQGYSQLPVDLDHQCTLVTGAEYQRLAQHIQATFEQNPQGELLPAGDEPQQASHFYLAKGSYSLLYNSNNWTAAGLRAAGIRTPRWSSLASAILGQFHHRCQVNPLP